MSGCAEGSADRGPPPAIARTLDALFRAEERKLRHYFRRRLRAGEDVQDFVQETFVRFAGAAFASVPSRPAAYLQRIAVNLLIDRARRPPTSTCQVNTEIAVRPEQEDAISVDDIMTVYRETLDAMPERTRTIFLLHRVEELPYREISLRLSISIPAVQKHVAKALERLALALHVENR